MRTRFGALGSLLAQSPRSSHPQPLKRFHSQYSRFQQNSRHFPQRPRTRVLLASSAGAAGLSSLFLVDDIKYGYDAVERSVRVLSALALSVNDYRVALNYPESDPDVESKMKECHQRCANRVFKVMEKNGGIFIKLGQHLSSLGYLLPPEWVDTFIPLQDRCPVSSYESVEQMFVDDTGKPISDMFDSFDQTPIGSASLAQVHMAILKGSQERVAVKVQHPEIAQWVPLDMSLTRFTFATLKKLFPEYDLEWLSREMDYSLPIELDFTEEAKNATKTKEHFAKIRGSALVIPSVHMAMKRILVMEYVAGRRADDLAYLDSQGIDRDEVSAALAHIFNEMIFGDGVALHCDPHGGNIAIRKNNKHMPNFDIILYDHGLYREIESQTKRDYARLWLAVIDADEPRMRKYAKKVANITDEQFPLFASAITGRDYGAVTTSVVSQRTSVEKDEINDALADGLLQQIVQLLGQVPRIMLLILKTNDLTRSLDENLHTRQGPVRTFLILARYCSRTVYQEESENVRKRGSLLWPPNFISLVGAWSAYMRTELRLALYETWLSIRQRFGLRPLEIQL